MQIQQDIKNNTGGRHIKLNPNCSEIIARLPSYGRFAEAEGVLEKIQKSNMDKKTKQKAEMMAEHYIYDEVTSVMTDSGGEECTQFYIPTAKQFIENGIPIADIPDLQFVDNPGGGGNWDIIEMSWDLAKLVAAGIISEEEEFEKWNEALWMNPEEIMLTEQCKTCLEGAADENCPNKENYLKRMVGECQGLPGISYQDKFNKIMDEAIKKEQEVKNES